MPRFRAEPGLAVVGLVLAAVLAGTALPSLLATQPVPPARAAGLSGVVGVVLRQQRTPTPGFGSGRGAAQAGTPRAAAPTARPPAATVTAAPPVATATLAPPRPTAVVPRRAATRAPAEPGLPLLTERASGHLAGVAGGAFRFFLLPHPGRGQSVEVRLSFTPGGATVAGGVRLRVLDRQGQEVAAGPASTASGGQGEASVSLVSDRADYYVVVVENYVPDTAIQFSLTVVPPVPLPIGNLPLATRDPLAPRRPTPTPAPIPLTSQASDILEGASGGAQVRYAIAYPGGNQEVTVDFTFAPGDAVVAQGVSFEVYDPDGRLVARAEGEPESSGVGAASASFSQERAGTYSIIVSNYVPGARIFYRLSITPELVAAPTPAAPPATPTAVPTLPRLPTAAPRITAEAATAIPAPTAPTSLALGQEVVLPTAGAVLVVPLDWTVQPVGSALVEAYGPTGTTYLRFLADTGAQAYFRRGGPGEYPWDVEAYTRDLLQLAATRLPQLLVLDWQSVGVYSSSWGGVPASLLYLSFLEPDAGYQPVRSLVLVLITPAGYGVIAQVEALDYSFTANQTELLDIVLSLKVE